MGVQLAVPVHVPFAANATAFDVVNTLRYFVPSQSSVDRCQVLEQWQPM